MGGCRCSYRSCRVRSDGQTHMFHFPVFDKMRCHQWITNSHKPNFLNLKLSQLKNRVICEHHFKDDNFMNVTKGKLKTTAIPTEDGPYCVPEKNSIMVTVANDRPVIPINIDDIENETLNYVEKKAHSSVKYGDFLISDVTELFNSSCTNIDNEVSLNVSSKNIKLNNRFIDGTKSKSLLEGTHNYTIIYPNEEETKDTNETLQFNTLDLTPNQSTVRCQEVEDPSIVNTPTEIKQTKSLYISRSNSYKKNPDKVVQILSEKTISEPVLIDGKLEPVSTSMIISSHARKIQNSAFTQSDWHLKPQLKSKGNNSVQTNIQEVLAEQTIPIEYTNPDVKTVYEENHNVIFDDENHSKFNHFNTAENPNTVNIEVQNEQKQNEPEQFELLKCMIEDSDKYMQPEYVSKLIDKPIITPTSTPVYKSILKNKITPEKLAAIEAKRKFNLKLRDVISSCLDNIDSQVEEKNTAQKKILTNKRSICTKEPSASSPSDIMDLLETRLQKMEDTLLTKIDQNTQKINELKRTVRPSKNTKNANTQTYLNHMTELSQKKYLYKEISKFLSPDAIITVYEELFRQPPEDIETSTPRKLRRRR